MCVAKRFPDCKITKKRYIGESRHSTCSHTLFPSIAGNVPSDGINMEYSEIPTAGIVVVLIGVIFSIVFAAGLGIGSLIFRNNKLVLLAYEKCNVIKSQCIAVYIYIYVCVCVCL